MNLEIGRLNESLPKFYVKMDRLKKLSGETE